MVSAQFWLGFAVIFGILLLWGYAALSCGELRIRRGPVGATVRSTSAKPEAAERREAA